MRSCPAVLLAIFVAALLLLQPGQVLAGEAAFPRGAPLSGAMAATWPGAGGRGGATGQSVAGPGYRKSGGSRLGQLQRSGLHHRG